MNEIKTLEELNDTINNNEITILDYYGDFCSPCKVIKSLLEDISQSEGVSISKINIESAYELTIDYNIRAVPTVLILKNGKEVERLIGAKFKDDYLNAINKYKDEIQDNN